MKSTNCMYVWTGIRLLLGAELFFSPILFSQISPVYSEVQLHVKPCWLSALVQLPSFSQGLGLQSSSVEKSESINDKSSSEHELC